MKIAEACIIEAATAQTDIAAACGENASIKYLEGMSLFPQAYPVDGSAPPPMVILPLLLFRVA